MADQNLFSLYADDEPSQQEQAMALAAALRGQRGLGQAMAMHPLLAKTGQGMLADVGQREEMLANAGKARGAQTFQQALAKQRAGDEMAQERYRAGEAMNRLNAELGGRAKADAAKVESAKSEALMKTEGDLRRQLSDMPATREILKRKDAYAIVKGASNGAEGDIPLLYSFMHLVEPGSAVMANDFQQVGQTGGLPAQVQGYFNSMVSKGKLTDAVRKKIRAEADATWKSASGSYRPIYDHYGKLADTYGAKRENVLIPMDFGDEPAPAGGQAPVRQGVSSVNLNGAPEPVRIKSDAEYEALPSGTPFVDPEGNQRTKP